MLRSQFTGLSDRQSPFTVNKTMQSQFTVNCLFTDHEELKMAITNHKEFKMPITCHENKYIYPTLWSLNLSLSRSLEGLIYEAMLVYFVNGGMKDLRVNWMLVVWVPC